LQSNSGIRNLGLGIRVYSLQLKISPMDYKGYKELECYIQAKLLRTFISELSKKFPAHENFC
jgi:ribosomal protein S18